MDKFLFDLFRDELILCAVKAGERVGILSEDLVRRDYALAFAAAAEALGADAVHVNIAKRPGSFFGPGNSLRGRQAAIDALKATDLVIDLVGLLWSAEQDAITATGTRMLLVLEPPSVLARLRTSREARARVETAADMLSGAKKLRVTSPGGTDVTYRIGNMRTIGQYGYTDEPGRWDAWSGSFVWTGGDEDGVDGRVVIDAGDLLLDPVMRYVAQPITLEIEHGMIVSIEGGGAEGAILRNFISGFNDPRAYAISHIGWGMDANADWNFLAFSPEATHSVGADGRCHYGNVLFSLGPNTELGGSNDTLCHLDIPLRGCSLFLDDHPIVQEGEIVPATLRSAAR
ncbi:MAG: leucyl aminopeptidase [Sphingobium sp.]